MDLDKVKLKTVNQLSEDDKKLLNDNVDKLTDEDKTAYSSVLVSGEGASEEGESSEGNDTNSQNQDGGEDSSEAPASESKTEEPQAVAFKTEAEAKEFVRKELESQKQAAIDAATTPEEKKWVEDNWKPKDWNEGIKTAAEAAADIIEERQKEREKKGEENAKRLEKDWQSVRTTNKLPDRSTPEGKEIHDSMVKLAVKYGKKSFSEVYELWSQTPKEFGGGYDPVGAAKKIEDERKKTEVNDRKAAAARLTKQNPGAGSVKGSGSLNITYEDIKKPRAKLLREALQQA